MRLPRLRRYSLEPGRLERNPGGEWMLAADVMALLRQFGLEDLAENDDAEEGDNDVPMQS